SNWVPIMAFAALLAVPKVARASLLAQELTVLPDSSDVELTLKLTANLNCVDSQTAFPGTVGHVQYNGRSIRFNLFKYSPTTELALGSAPAVPVPLDIYVETTGACQVTALDPEMEPQKIDLEAAFASRDYASLALAHSPYIV